MANITHIPSPAATQSMRKKVASRTNTPETKRIPIGWA